MPIIRSRRLFRSTYLDLGVVLHRDPVVAFCRAVVAALKGLFADLAAVRTVAEVAVVRQAGSVVAVGHLGAKLGKKWWMASLKVLRCWVFLFLDQSLTMMTRESDYQGQTEAKLCMALLARENEQEI